MIVISQDASLIIPLDAQMDGVDDIADCIVLKRVVLGESGRPEGTEYYWADGTESMERLRAAYDYDAEHDMWTPKSMELRSPTSEEARSPIA